MEWTYYVMGIFLCLLAAFDLYVGVSNDAVNFMNSALGSRAASFRTIVIVAAIGIFCGAMLNNGMMDIARNGIFNPSDFSFHEVMLIFLAVMVTDILLLDLFNSLGMPTSTTVSLVFELLGAAFALSLMKMMHGGLHFTAYINGGKALAVIIAIFVSVGIAMVVGCVSMFLTRLWFTYRSPRNSSYKVGLFGGFALTSIVYFMLLKGMKHVAFVGADVPSFVEQHSLMVLAVCFVLTSCLMQLLHWMKVNTLRVIVVVGTFALAMAFAGNDLVNFIGVPLAGLSSIEVFRATPLADAHSLMMTGLNAPAQTPWYFLLGAATIMIAALAFSKKARKVAQTEIGLASQQEGNEMFGASRTARSIVRATRSLGQAVQGVLPVALVRWMERRMKKPQWVAADAPAFDLLRASINLVIAALLIALGTSLQLPLSTTYVTFMVAMGSSLADKAWSRESAVFRVTGVLTVIGGWFFTAATAFTAAVAVALLMYVGGQLMILGVIVLGLGVTIHSQYRFRHRKEGEEKGANDVLFSQMMGESDSGRIAMMLERHVAICAAEQLEKTVGHLMVVSEHLDTQQRKPIKKMSFNLKEDKRGLKLLLKKETLCMQRMSNAYSMRLATTFYLVHNYLRQTVYGLQRMSAAMLEHADHDFTPIDGEDAQRLAGLMIRMIRMMEKQAGAWKMGNKEEVASWVAESRLLDHDMKEFRHEIENSLMEMKEGFVAKMLLIHLLQECEQLNRELKQLVRNEARFAALCRNI